MRHKEYLEIIGDAMEDAHNERDEAWADSPEVRLSDSDLDDWAKIWGERDCPILGSSRTYVASDGSEWYISRENPPIPTREFDWAYVSKEYDGAPDSHDERSGFAASKEDCIKMIEEWIYQNDN